MANPHYRKQPGGQRFARPLGRRYPKQQVTSFGTLRQSEDRAQATLDKWQAGADEYEAQMQAMRAKRHKFVPMGKTSICDKCGLPQDYPFHT